MTEPTAPAHRMVALATTQKQMDERYDLTRSDLNEEAMRFVRNCCNRIGAEAEIPGCARAYSG